MGSIEVRFKLIRHSYGHSNFTLGPILFLDVHTTYEEVIRLLTQMRFLLPPDDHRLRYSMLLQQYGRGSDHSNIARTIGYGGSLTEGQTLADFISSKQTIFLICNIIQEDAPFPKKKPRSAPPSLDETLNAVLTSPAVSIINLTASAVTITTALIMVVKWWRKTHQAQGTGSSQHFPQPGKTDIYAIRLRMTDGRERTMQQWLTEPDELKRFIDVFLQPSSQMKPTEVVFVLWNRDTVVVDVSEGAQGNLQLDEMLKYLKINAVEK